LTRGALAYLKQRQWLERAARFDVVAIQFSQHPKLFIDAGTGKVDMKRLMKTAVHVEHYRNAFEATGDSFYG
jgi:Holliday junction resolvase-like predicted endonuclease